MKKIIAVFLLVSLVFAMTACNKVSDGAKSAKEEAISGSLDFLMKKGLPLKCTWDASVEDESASGVVYVKGEKFRTEISNSEGSVYSISDGTDMYTWTDFQKDGFKMNLEKLKEMGNDVETDVETEDVEFQSLDAEYNYRCLPWVANENKFVPPSDVEFVDYTELMEQMQEIADGFENIDQDDPCSYCSMLPEGEARDDCLANC